MHESVNVRQKAQYRKNACVNEACWKALYKNQYIYIYAHMGPHRKLAQSVTAHQSQLSAASATAC